MNTAEVGSAHTEHIAASVLKAVSASIHFHIWIWLGGGAGSLPFWIEDVSFLLSCSSQKWTLPGSCWSTTWRKGSSLQAWDDKRTDLKQTTLSNISADIYSLGNKCSIRFLCLQSCFTLSYTTFEISALVKSSRHFCLQLKSSSSSEQDLAECLQHTDGWDHCHYWYES